MKLLFFEIADIMYLMLEIKLKLYPFSLHSKLVWRQNVWVVVLFKPKTNWT